MKKSSIVEITKFGIGLSLAMVIVLITGSVATFAEDSVTDWPEFYDSGSGISYKSLGTIRHDVADSFYTGLAAQSQYDAVGEVLSTNSSGSFRCSGTLISPSHVLTAAHCMAGSPTSITFNLPSASGLIGDISKVDVHPDWTGNLTNGKDIAIFELTVPVGGVTPALRYDSGVHGNELGKIGTSVGYGRTGTGLTGVTTPSGTRRAGQNILDVFGSAFGWSADLLLVDFDSPSAPGESTFGSSTPLDLEYNIASGDSGGGTFTEIAGIHYVTGVHSLLWWNDGTGDSDYGDGGGFTRVSLFNSWIDTVIVPEPGTAGLLILGVLAMLAPRRQ